MKFNMKLAIRIFLLIAASPVWCQIFTEKQENMITEFVKNAIDCHHVPGIAISVVKGTNVWTRGFGQADLDTQRPVEPTTLFAPGSLTKAFTMTLLAMVLNEASFSWSTKLSEIPEVNFTFIDEELTRDATLADLLAHRTGLWDTSDFGFIAGYPEGITMECLSSRLKYVPQEFAFRSDSFQYNNLMYVLLGRVTEVLGKDSWENLMTSRIFEPLGMSSSKILTCHDDVLTGDVAKPYIRPRDEFLNGTTGLYTISPYEPAGGILSNAEDMAKWLLFNLNNGATPDGKRLVDPDLFSEAFKSQRKVTRQRDLAHPPFPINITNSGYGFAWYISSYRGYDRIWHSGSFFSYMSYIWLFPDQDVGLYVNINGPGSRKGPGEAIKVISSFVSDLALGLEPWLNTTTACTFPAPWQKTSSFEVPEPPKFTNDKMEDFIGKYGSPLLPDISIQLADSSDGDQLIVVWNRIKGILLPTNNSDGFNFKITNPWEETQELMVTDTFAIIFPVVFHRNSRNMVMGLNITFGDTSHMTFRKDTRFVVDCKLSLSTTCPKHKNSLKTLM